MPQQPEWRTKEREGGSYLQSFRDALPSGTTVLYFGALGLVGTLGVIEWPVVAAIGVGTAVAQRAASGDSSGARSGAGSSGRERE